MDRVYGRIVTKKEEKFLKRNKMLVAAEEGDMVPVFEATDVLDVLPTKKDDIKMLHKDLGGSGAGNRMILFETDEKPVVEGIPLRKIRWLKEAKFKSGTLIRNIKT